MLHLKTKTTFRRCAAASRRHRGSLESSTCSRGVAERQAALLIAKSRRRGLFHPPGGARLGSLS